jgi:hypothetical protein
VDSQPIKGELIISMSFFSHKKYGTVFKGILVVLYLVLLGSQLSHKFYLCANFSSRVSQGCHCNFAHTQPFSHCGSSLLNHRNTSSFSLDKRYELKPIFALLSLAFSLNPVFVDDKKEFNSFCQVFIPSYFAIHPLRGPPSV